MASDSAFDALLREVARATPAPLPTALGLPLGSTLADGRFRLVRRLGRGASGIVYEAHDGERGESVALKLLSSLSADAIYRLKNEFRALVDVQHDHLVRLYELFASDGAWYFTMELVPGEPFDRFVRPDEVLSESRLRAAFAELVDAVRALHAAGQLHRDLKPSNVLVTSAGRVVVLDFGLTVALAEGGVGQTLSEPAVCGTPAYMAPEQAARGVASEASDFYALGVMLCEALTGAPYVRGTDLTIVPEAPALADLARLAEALLAREPDARPTGREIARCLHSEYQVPLPPEQTESDRALVGRERELAMLEAAFRESLTGRAVVIDIEGESGVGKTTLCAALLAHRTVEPQPTLLTSRCYERESMLFKAFDPLLDGVSRSLRTRALADLVPPADVAALAQLFPVLLRVPSVAALPPPPDEPPRARRVRAFDGFVALLRAMRAHGPLMLVLDDLQWADADSLEFLRHVLAQPDADFGLMLLSRRPGGPALSALLERARENRGLVVRSLAVFGLAPAEVDSLVRPWVAQPAAIERLVQQAAGNPYVALALARYAAGANVAPQALTLAAALAARLAVLPTAASRLLRMIALAGEPVPIGPLLHAADAEHAALEALRRDKLVRLASGSHGRERTVECMHDRIRESLTAQLDESERHALALRLADALASEVDTCTSLLRRCLLEAGRRDEARRIALFAARRAAEAHAFERAADLYGEAVEALPPDADERDHLLEKWALALEYAGRSNDAADVYRQASVRATGARRSELTRRAAQQLLGTDRFAEGLALLDALCRESNVPFPRGGLPSLARLGWNAARLVRWDPLRSPISGSITTAQLELAETLVIGLNSFAPLEAACAASQYLRMAVDARNLSHLTGALGFAAVAAARYAPRSRPVRSMVAQLSSLAEQWPSPRLAGFRAFVVGTVACFGREFEQARRELSTARALLADVPGVDGMHDSATVQDQFCASWLGRYADLVRDTPPAIDDAFRRGRIWLGVSLSSRLCLPAWLTVDDVDAARSRLREARRRWRPRSGPLQLDFDLLTAEVSLALYVGEPRVGLEVLNGGVATFDHARLAWFKGEHSPGFSLWRARCAAALLLEERSPAIRRELEATIVRALAVLRRTRRGMRDLSLGLEAALALARGDRAACAVLIRRALASPDVVPRGVHASTLRLCLGRIMGDAAGRSLIENARAQLSSEGVRNEAAMVRLSWPGLTI